MVAALSSHRQAVTLQAQFSSAVREGFQATLTWHQGRWPCPAVSTAVHANQSCTQPFGSLLPPRSRCRAAHNPTVRFLCAGAIVAREDGASGDLPSTVPSCRWAFSVEPQFGWGDAGEDQKATAGWLAALPVFEPHWQVCLPRSLDTLPSGALTTVHGKGAAVGRQVT